MEFGGAPVVSLPVEGLESNRAAIEQWRAGVLRHPGLVEGVFGQRVAARVGPAYIGYTDRKHFRPVSLGTARSLTDDEEAGARSARELRG